MVEPMIPAVGEDGKRKWGQATPQESALGYELAELSGMYQQPIPEEARVWASVLLTETVCSGC